MKNTERLRRALAAHHGLPWRRYRVRVLRPRSGRRARLAEAFGCASPARYALAVRSGYEWVAVAVGDRPREMVAAYLGEQA